MNRRQGFTLVELLVYTAIFAIVAGLLTTIFYVVINTQKKTSVSSEVSQQLNLVLVTVQRLVGDASLVEAVYEGSNPSSTCTTFCTLKLRREDPAKDPTIISSDATGIYLQEGSSPQVTLTTNKVLINHVEADAGNGAEVEGLSAIEGSVTGGVPVPPPSGGGLPTTGIPVAAAIILAVSALLGTKWAFAANRW